MDHAFIPSYTEYYEFSKPVRECENTRAVLYLVCVGYSYPRADKNCYENCGGTHQSLKRNWQWRAGYSQPLYVFRHPSSGAGTSACLNGACHIPPRDAIGVTRTGHTCVELGGCGDVRVRVRVPVWMCV
jgi:hypothetical protein